MDRQIVRANTYFVAEPLPDPDDPEPLPGPDDSEPLPGPDDPVNLPGKDDSYDSSELNDESTSES